jgi:hypothetical protein
VLDLLRVAAAAAGLRTPERLSLQRLTAPFPLAGPKRISIAPRPAVASAGAQVPEGTEVTVDSDFEGYPPVPLTDGKINPKTDDWTAVAWASAEEATEHWITLQFRAPQRVGQVTLYWALDNGAYLNSRNVVVEVRQAGQWSPVTATGTEVSPERTTVRFAPVTVEAVRIRQPIGGGPATRPNIMWVSEVSLG